jgi:hypothetical protein
MPDTPLNGAGRLRSPDMPIGVTSSYVTTTHGSRYCAGEAFTLDNEPNTSLVLTGVVAATCDQFPAQDSSLPEEHRTTI